MLVTLTFILACPWLQSGAIYGCFKLIRITGSDTILRAIAVVFALAGAYFAVVPLVQLGSQAKRQRTLRMAADDGDESARQAYLAFDMHRHLWCHLGFIWCVQALIPLLITPTLYAKSIANLLVETHGVAKHQSEMNAVDDSLEMLRSRGIFTPLR